MNIQPFIQLPTSTGLLLGQVFRTYKFTKQFDPRHPGPAAFFPEFLEKFDKEVELERLSFIAEALANGADISIKVSDHIARMPDGVDLLLDLLTFERAVSLQ